MTPSRALLVASLLAPLLGVACTHPKDQPSDSSTGGDSAVTTDSGDTSGDSASTYDFSGIESAVKKDIRNSNASGASIAIYNHGQIVYAQGFGSADPDNQQDITPDTLFEIGSDTKKLTAIALLQKIESGDLSLDDTVSDALGGFAFANAGSPETADWSTKTTLHQLISHQGGLFDYLPWNSTSDDSDLAAYTFGDYQANLWAMAPGGEMWNYANPNFVLAGLAEELHDTRTYPDIVEQDVFAPLGMTRTYARKSEAEAAGDYAIGYGYSVSGTMDPNVWADPGNYTVGTVQMADMQDSAWCRPAGGTTWSTPTDMMKVADFLMHGNTAVLSDDLRTQISTGQVLAYPEYPADAYGYGLFIAQGLSLGTDAYYDVPVWEHGGNTLTHTSAFYILPDSDFAVSVLSNGYGDDFTNTVVAAVQAVATLPDPVAAPAPPTDEGDITRYAGVYADHLLGDITVGVGSDGTTLTIRIPALTDLGYTVGETLTPDISGVYLMTIDRVQYDVTFVDGTDGTPAKYLRNRSFVGTRLGSGMANSAHPTRAQVDRLLLQATLDREPLPGPALAGGQVEGATSCPARSVPSTRSDAVVLAGTCAGVDGSREVTNTRDGSNAKARRE